MIRGRIVQNLCEFVILLGVTAFCLFDLWGDRRAQKLQKKRKPNPERDHG